MFKSLSNIEPDELANLAVNITIILLIIALCFSSYLRLYYRLKNMFVSRKLASVVSILIVLLGLIPILCIYNAII